MRYDPKNKMTWPKHLLILEHDSAMIKEKKERDKIEKENKELKKKIEQLENPAN